MKQQAHVLLLLEFGYIAHNQLFHNSDKSTKACPDCNLETSATTQEPHKGGKK